jgi:hypothetical protein
MQAVYSLLGEKVLNLIIAQCVISLASAISLLVCVFKVRRCLPLLPLVAVAMAAFQFDNLSLASDVAPLTESLFSSCLVFAAGFLILAVFNGGWLPFLLASAFMALSVSVRPTGQFLIVSYAMSMLFLLLNRTCYSWRSIMAFAIPLPALIFLWLSYNYFSFGSFKLTRGFELTLICGTSMYLSESKDYSPQLNEAIRRLDARVSPSDRAIIRGGSWDWRKMSSVYYRLEYWDIAEIWNNFDRMDIPERISLEKSGLFKKLGMDAIKRDFGIFLRIYYMNLQLYFTDNMRQCYYFYANLPHFVKQIYIKKPFEKYLKGPPKDFLLEYYYPESMPKAFKIVKAPDSPDGCVVEMAPPPFPVKLHKRLSIWAFALFHKPFWSWLCIALCFISGLATLATRFRNANIFVMLLLSSAPVGHGFICSVFSNTLRFSGPTMFFYYLSAALIPLLFMGNIMPERKDALLSAPSPGNGKDGRDA